MSILSVDLASRRYQDNGIAVLTGSLSQPQARLVMPSELGLSGVPNPGEFAEALHELAVAEGVTAIFLDGPQGWREEKTDRVHARACERLTQTPGKTGPPGVVVPGTWKCMAEFAISMFDELAHHGWPRFEGSSTRCAFESFPTHAWRTLGHTPLPGKSGAATRYREWAARLETKHGVRWPQPPTHDEIQAVIAGLAGLQMSERGLGSCDIKGKAPFIERGHWREGFIVSPAVEARLGPGGSALGECS